MYVCVCVYTYIYGNRINLVYGSEFHAPSQSSGIQYYFHLPKNKQIITVIHIYHIKIQNIILISFLSFNATLFYQ